MTNDKLIEEMDEAYKKVALADVPEDELSEWLPEDYHMPAMEAALAVVLDKLQGGECVEVARGALCNLWEVGATVTMQESSEVATKAIAEHLGGE